MKRLFLLIATFVACLGLQAQRTYTNIDNFESGSTSATVLWSGTSSVVSNTTGSSGSKVLQVTDANGYPFVNLPVSLSSGSTWTDYDGIEVDIYPKSGTNAGSGRKAVGLDLSLLKTYENAGVTYKDASGATISDVISWVGQNKGVNYVRIRLFVDPTSNYAKALAGGSSYMSQLGGDLATVKVLGKRVKDAGLNFLLDIQYSDGWADPGKQLMPESWTSTCTSQTALQNKVYSYTKDVLNQLVAYGATPDMVQVGNEITYGMFYTSYDTPAGNYTNNGITANYSSTNAGRNGIHCFATYWADNTPSQDSYWVNLCNVIKKGCQAVREVCPSAKIMLHTERSTYTDWKCTASGYTNMYLAEMFYQKMQEKSVDYDVIGLSYYPEDHGTISKLNTILSALESRFPAKEIMLAEYGYSNNYYRGDYKPGDIGYYKRNDTNNSCPLAQKEFISALISTLNSHSKVTGMFYWFAEENESTNAGPYASGYRNTGLWANETTNYASNKTSTAYSATKGCALPALDVLADFQDASSVTTKSAYYAQTWLKFYDQAGTANHLHKKVGLNVEDQYGADFTSGLDKWYTVRFGFNTDSIADYISAVGSAPTSINLELRNYTNPSETNNDFYLDNVRFYKTVNESYALDFEDGTINSPSSAVHDGYCSGSQVVKSNPYKTGINTSNKVMTVTNNWVSGCDLYQWYVDLPENLSLYDTIYMDINPVDNSKAWVTCKIGGPDSWTGTWTSFYDNSEIQMTLNSWYRLALPLTALNDYTATRLYFGMWESGYSVDNITFHKAPQVYTVTWDATTNGGTCATATTSVTEGNAVGTLPTASKTGNTFNGWFTAATGGTQITAATVPTGDVTYYAQFTPNTYTITYNKGQYGSGTTIANGTKTYGVNFTLSSSTYTRTGYTQTGWSTTDGGAKAYNLGGTYTGNADLNLYPFWTANTNTAYTVRHQWQNITDNYYTLHESETKYGTTAQQTAATAKTYTGFTAKAFSQATIAADGSTVIDIYYDRQTFTITWKNGDNQTIETDNNVRYGATPTYDGATPTKTATAQYTYTFNNTWSPALAMVTANATYTAQFDQTVNSYTITWKNENGSIIEQTTVAYGETPTHADVTKSADAEWTYTFAGWTPTIVPVVGDAEYTAVFSKTHNFYTITWKNEDGTTIDETTVEYGVMPTHADPTKSATAQYTYTFAGWTPALTAVTGNATYTAQFSQTVNQYTLTVIGATGGGTYDYGTSVTMTPSPANNYHFTQWLDGNTDNPRTVTVTGNATYTALSEEDAKTTVYLFPTVWEVDNAKFAAYVFEDGKAAAWSPLMTKTADGKAYTAQVYDYAKIIFVRLKNTATGGDWDDKWNQTADLNRSAAYNCYQITGWGDADGRWRNYPFYFVDFRDYDATLLKTDTVDSGQAATAPANPSRQGYTFSGWDTQFNNVTADLTVTAQYTVNYHTLNWHSDGDQLAGDYTHGQVAYGTPIVAPDTPTKQGYLFNRWNPSVPATMPDEDLFLEAFWNPSTNTPYTVRHMQQNIADDNYTEFETQTLYGTTDNITAAAAKTYTGFQAQSFDQDLVLPDGSTVIEIYYTRLSFNLVWDVNGGNALSGNYTSGSVRYDAPITPPTNPTRAGYTFTGWQPEAPAKMPAENLTLVAQWTESGSTPYTVRHFKQKLDCSTYNNEPDDVDNLTGKTGSSVTPGVKSYEGFTAPATQTVTILADGSRVVDYYYTRNSYSITWEPNGGDLGGSFSNGPVPYGDNISVPTPMRQGYDFAGWDPAEVPTTMPAHDLFFTAQWTAMTNIKYTVRHQWQNIGDNDYTLHESETLYGTTDSPTSAVAKTYTGFTAQTITQQTIAADGNTVVDVYYNRNTFTITWKNHDGSTLETDLNVRYGATPKYDGAVPTKAATDQYSYTFSEWSPAVVAVSEDAVYTAQFEAVLNKYTIRFLNWNGVELYTMQVEYGTTPVYEPLPPTKPETDQYKYTFAGWDPELAPVTGDATYTAVFTESLQVYEVCFYNGDQLLTCGEWEYGSTPVYSGPEPTQEPDDTFFYTFCGWGEIHPVNGDNSYSAQFCGTWRYYDGVVINSSDPTMGTVAADPQKNTYEYGEEVTITATPNEGYHFTEWQDEDGNTVSTETTTTVTVTANTTITAVFEPNTDTRYLVHHLQQNLNDDLYTLVETDTLYGTTGRLTQVETVRRNYPGFYIKYCEDVPIAADGSTELNALYDRLTYSVRWIVEDAERLDTLRYGAMPDYGSVPTKQGDAQYSYTFVGWDPEVVTVTADATYRAVFSSEVNRYTVTFHANGHATDPEPASVEYGHIVNCTTLYADDGWIFDGWFREAACQNQWNCQQDVVTANIDLYAKWTPSENMFYWVNYWQQNIYDDDYTLVEFEQIKGTTGQMTQAEAKTYTGFTMLPFSQEPIDTNTVINIYYDRLRYEVNFVVEGVVVQSDSVRYYGSAEYRGETPTKPETEQFYYTFWCWDKATNMPIVADVTFTALFNEYSKGGGTGLESIVITESGISGPKGMRIYDLTGKDVTNAMDHLYQGSYIIVLDGQTWKVMIP